MVSVPAATDWKVARTTIFESIICCSRESGYGSGATWPVVSGRGCGGRKVGSGVGVGVEVSFRGETVASSLALAGIVAVVAVVAPGSGVVSSPMPTGVGEVSVASPQATMRRMQTLMANDAAVFQHVEADGLDDGWMWHGGGFCSWIGGSPISILSHKGERGDGFPYAREKGMGGDDGCSKVFSERLRSFKWPSSPEDTMVAPANSLPGRRGRFWRP